MSDTVHQDTHHGTPQNGNKQLGQEASMSSSQKPTDQQPAPSYSAEPEKPSSPKPSTSQPASFPLANSQLSSSSSTSTSNLLVWSDRPDSGCPQLRPVSPTDILDMPPIITSELSQLYSSCQVSLQLLDLYKKHGHLIPDQLVYQCHQLKLQVERPWEQLQQSFLEARSRDLSRSTPNALLDPTLRVMTIPFTDLEQVKTAAARLKEQAFLDAQAHFDQGRLPKSPRSQQTDNYGGSSRQVVPRMSHQVAQYYPRLNTQPFAAPERPLSSLASPTLTSASDRTGVHPTTRPEGVRFFSGVAPTLNTSSSSIDPTTVPLASANPTGASHAQLPLPNPLELCGAYAHSSGRLYHSPNFSNETQFLSMFPTTLNNRVTDTANGRLFGDTMNDGMASRLDNDMWFPSQGGELRTHQEPSFSRSSLAGHVYPPSPTLRDNQFPYQPIAIPTTPVQMSHMSLSAQPSSPSLVQAEQGREFFQMVQQVYNHPLHAHPSSPDTHQFNQRHEVQPGVQQGFPPSGLNGDHRPEAGGKRSVHYTQQHLGLGGLPDRINRPPHTHVASPLTTMPQQPLQATSSVQPFQSPSLPNLMTEAQLQEIYLSERAELEHRHLVKLQKLVDQKRSELERLERQKAAKQMPRHEALSCQKELASGPAGGQQQMLGMGSNRSSAGEGLVLLAEDGLGSVEATQAGQGMDTGAAKARLGQADGHAHSPVQTLESDRQPPPRGDSLVECVASPQHPIPPNRRLQHTTTPSPPTPSVSPVSGQKRAVPSSSPSTVCPEGTSEPTGFRSTKRIRTSVGVQKMAEVAVALKIDCGDPTLAGSVEVGPVEVDEEAGVELGTVGVDGEVRTVQAGWEAETVDVKEVERTLGMDEEAGTLEASRDVVMAEVTGGTEEEEEKVAMEEEKQEGEVAQDGEVGIVESNGEVVTLEANGGAGVAEVMGGRGEEEEVMRGEDEQKGEVVEAERLGSAGGAGARCAPDGVEPAALVSPHLVRRIGCRRTPCELGDNKEGSPVQLVPSGDRDESEAKTHACLPDHDPAWFAPSTPTSSSLAPQDVHNVTESLSSAPAVALGEPQMFNRGPGWRPPRVMVVIPRIPGPIKNGPVWHELGVQAELETAANEVQRNPRRSKCQPREIYRGAAASARAGKAGGKVGMKGQRRWRVGEEKNKKQHGERRKKKVGDVKAVLDARSKAVRTRSQSQGVRSCMHRLRPLTAVGCTNSRRFRSRLRNNRQRFKSQPEKNPKQSPSGPRHNPRKSQPEPRMDPIRRRALFPSQPAQIIHSHKDVVQYCNDWGEPHGFSVRTKTSRPGEEITVVCARRSKGCQWSMYWKLSKYEKEKGFVIIEDRIRGSHNHPGDGLDNNQLVSPKPEDC